MTAFMRWTQGLASRIDALVVQVENHDAQAESAIRRIERAVARARVHSAHVERDSENLVRREREAHGQEALWRDRARQERNDERALECLRRARREREAAQRLTQSLHEHRDMAGRLKQELQALERRLREVREQRSAFRIRAVQARAADAIRGADGCDLDDVFDRWDLQLTETEVQAGVSPEPVDRFVEEIERAEEDTELQQELAVLRQEDQ